MSTRSKRGRISDDRLKEAFGRVVRATSPAARKAKAVIKSGLQGYLNMSNSLADKMPGGGTRMKSRRHRRGR